MSTELEIIEQPQDKGLFAGGSVLAGLAALISASCCVLPIVLVNMGVSAAFVSNLAPFVRYRPQLIAATLVLLAIAFAVTFYKGRRPTMRLWGLTAIALSLSVAAYYIPYYESTILRWLGLR